MHDIFYQCLFSVDAWIYLSVVILAIFLFFRLRTGKRKIFFPQIPRLISSKGTSGKWKTEEKCREIFERLTGKKFTKIKPHFLKNPKTGRRLELDGFNPDIQTRIGKGLAFEYDGKQHSERVKYFQKTEKDYVNQVQRDFVKDRLCRQRGIYLIRIPHTVKAKQLEKYILGKLRECFI